MQQLLKAKILSCKVISLTHPLELKNLNSKIGDQKTVSKTRVAAAAGAGLELMYPKPN